MLKLRKALNGIRNEQIIEILDEKRNSYYRGVLGRLTMGTLYDLKDYKVKKIDVEVDSNSNMVYEVRIVK
jgi:hypothetical protein